MDNPKVNQRSDANPGWRGSGIPSLRYLLIARLKRVLFTAKSNIQEAKHLLLATAADLWNFHLWPRKRVCCPCCGWTGSGFLATSNWRAVTYHSRCPICDSRSRHRGQTKYLNTHHANFEGRRALVFAPEKIILTILGVIKVGAVVTSDYQSRDVDLPGEDIQKMSLDSGIFDLIICNHVLEHVPDDNAAIAECARILRPDGIALFTIPGEFSQADTWYFDNTDSNGHYRHYGLDVLDKFRRSFSIVEAVDMNTLGLDCEKIRKQDMLFVCRLV